MSINAGMAFIATATWCGRCVTRAEWECWAFLQCPPTCCKRQSAMLKAVDPACFGVDIIARFSGIQHIEVCVTERVPVVVFLWDDVPDEWLIASAGGGQSHLVSIGSVDEAKAALRHGAARARRARHQGWRSHPRRRGQLPSRRPPQSSMQSLACLSWLRVALPMVGPLLLRWHSAPMPSGSGLAYSRASRPMPIPR